MQAVDARLQMMGTECAKTKCRSSGLGHLPELCIAFILRLTTPRDVARLACVSTTFRAASDSDVVWEPKLPPAYADILAGASKAPPRTFSKKEIYKFFCNRVFSSGCTSDYWLDRATGGICQSIGARELCFVWEHENSWNWDHRHGSRFDEVVHLRADRWPTVFKKLTCFLHPGTYTLSWRMLHSYHELFHSYQELVEFGIEATGNIEVKMLWCFTQQGVWRQWSHGQEESRLRRWNDGTWMEVDVGEFTVESKDYPVILTCYLQDRGVNNGLPGGGLYLDGFVIRPSNFIPSLTSSYNQSTGQTGD